MIRILALCLMAAPAFAEGPTCYPHDQMVGFLRNHFKERVRSIGRLAGDERISEMFTNPRTGTWTTVETDALGMSCVVESGTNFMHVPQGDKT